MWATGGLEEAQSGCIDVREASLGLEQGLTWYFVLQAHQKHQWFVNSRAHHRHGGSSFLVLVSWLWFAFNLQDEALFLVQSERVTRGSQGTRATWVSVYGWFEFVLFYQQGSRLIFCGLLCLLSVWLSLSGQDKTVPQLDRHSRFFINRGSPPGCPQMCTSHIAGKFWSIRSTGLLGLDHTTSE